MGYVTTYEIIAMLVVALVLVFNAGFVAGASWRRLHQPRQNDDCRLTSPDDVDELQDVARRIGS